MTTYADLRAINVNAHTEKKNGLTYLSWAWAVDQLLMRDPRATWAYRESADGVPFVRIGDTAMVFCTVRAFDVERTAQLPVMDHKNKPIPNPDAFQVNNAMQRCLAKAIALHGIGLYIYAGEDLPPEGEPEAWSEQQSAAFEQWISDTIDNVNACDTPEAVKEAWGRAVATLNQGGPPADVLKAAHAAIKGAVIQRGQELSRAAA